MVQKASIASIPSCTHNAEELAAAISSKRELCLFAAETRLALAASRKHLENEISVIELD